MVVIQHTDLFSNEGMFKFVFHLQESDLFSLGFFSSIINLKKYELFIEQFLPFLSLQLND